MNIISSKKYRLYFKLFLIFFGLFLVFLLYQFGYFSKDHLIINLPRSHYSVGDNVLFHITATDSSGKANCTSPLKLQIVKQKSRNSDRINQTLTPVATQTCGTSGSSEPDFIVRYITGQPGEYRLTLINQDSKKRLKAKMIVSNEPPDLLVERWSATRVIVTPDLRYPMVIKITANKDFRGDFVEPLPANFKLAWYGAAKVENNLLSWPLNLTAGQSIELKYEYLPSASDDPLQIIGQDHSWTVIIDKSDPKS